MKYIDAIGTEEVSLFEGYQSKIPHSELRNGEYYVITLLIKSVPINDENENRIATAYHYNQSKSVKKETIMYYVAQYNEHNFYLYCEDIYGHSESSKWDVRMISSPVYYEYGLYDHKFHPYRYPSQYIRNIQKRLIELGYPCEVNGIYDETMGTAVNNLIDDFKLSDKTRSDNGYYSINEAVKEAIYPGSEW